MLMRSWMFVMLSVLLTACSLLSPVKPECIHEYKIEAKFNAHRAGHATSKTLGVTMPMSSRMYAGTDMLYSECPNEYNRFAKNRWVESPMQMLQPLIISAIQSRHHYKVVAPAVGVGRYDLMLNTQVLDFYQEFCQRGSVFKLTLRAQIIDAASGKVIANKEFSVTQPAPYPAPHGGAIAANIASERVLNELAQWSAGYHSNFS